ncbi:ParA family protein [Methylophaga sp. OBS1]|uniref:ParA family protein n=1 Tax=Methylophaga sp. OBS1 TaxID=2991933 RepID=UPI002251FE99|nr:ParA family protein [Methylophaga sp. OBS1]MCX4193871.1 ParA family protein [Methylophaga sp. OBS1]
MTQNAARIIAIMNQKGGVGKTTTTVNLGHALAQAGQRVALMDLDPQGQVATSLGFDNHSPGLDSVLLDGVAIDDIKMSARDNLDLIVAGNRLNEFEHTSEGGIQRGHRLREALQQSSLNQYDYVLIDCPPSSGLLGVNAMFAAAELLIPVSGDYLSLQGLSRMIQILKRAEELAGHRIRLWLVSTRMQMRRRLTEEVRNRILKYFPGRVLFTPVRENVSLAECPSFGKTIFDYRKNSPGAEDYQSLAQDLMRGRTADG